MELAQTDYPGPEGPTLLMAHGLYGSARNFGAICKRLSKDRGVRAVDMRNHGDSPWAESHSYSDMADDLFQASAPGMDLLGHSMGGKAAMVMALKHPKQLRRLIVADIAPVAYDHTQLHMIDAMQSVDLSAITTRGEAGAQMIDQLPEDALRAFALQSLDLANKKWRLNLDVLRAYMDQIIGFPEVSGTFEGPTLFLTGGNSDYVQDSHRAKILTHFPNAEFVSIEGAGHWLHAEKPREFIDEVSRFLA